MKNYLGKIKFLSWILIFSLILPANLRADELVNDGLSKGIPPRTKSIPETPPSATPSSPIVKSAPPQSIDPMSGPLTPATPPAVPNNGGSSSASQSSISQPPSAVSTPKNGGSGIVKNPNETFINVPAPTTPGTQAGSNMVQAGVNTTPNSFPAQTPASGYQVVAAPTSPGTPAGSYLVPTGVNATPNQAPNPNAGVEPGYHYDGMGHLVPDLLPTPQALALNSPDGYHYEAVSSPILGMGLQMVANTLPDPASFPAEEVPGFHAVGTTMPNGSAGFILEPDPVTTSTSSSTQTQTQSSTQQQINNGQGIIVNGTLTPGGPIATTAPVVIQSPVTPIQPVQPVTTTKTRIIDEPHETKLIEGPMNKDDDPDPNAAAYKFELYGIKHVRQTYQDTYDENNALIKSELINTELIPFNLATDCGCFIKFVTAVPPPASDPLASLYYFAPPHGAGLVVNFTGSNDVFSFEVDGKGWRLEKNGNGYDYYSFETVNPTTGLAIGYERREYYTAYSIGASNYFPDRDNRMEMFKIQYNLINDPQKRWIQREYGMAMNNRLYWKTPAVHKFVVRANPPEGIQISDDGKDYTQEVTVTIDAGFKTTTKAVYHVIMPQEDIDASFEIPINQVVDPPKRTLLDHIDFYRDYMRTDGTRFIFIRSNGGMGNMILADVSQITATTPGAANYYATYDNTKSLDFLRKKKKKKK